MKGRAVLFFNFNKLKVFFVLFLILFISELPAFAINEKYNPRKMEAANAVISKYEIEISKAPTVEAYEGLINGFKMRKESYFSANDCKDIDDKIYDAYKNILKIAPKNYNAMVYVIEEDMNKGRFEGISERVAEVLKDNAEQYKIRLLNGKLLYFDFKFEQAILEITKGITLMPESAGEEAKHYKKILTNANRFLNTIKKYMPAAVKEPESAQGYYEIAAIYLDNEMIKHSSNLETGIKYLNKCIEKDKNNGEAYVLLAEVTAERKQEYAEAMKILRNLDNIEVSKQLLKKARNLSQKYYRQNIYLKKK